MYEVQIKVNFRAAHRLLDYDGNCHRLHGEFYTVIVKFRGNELQNNGILIDFGDAKRVIKKYIEEKLDHGVILNCKDNEAIKAMEAIEDRRVFFMNGNPTAENIARFLYGEIKNELRLPVYKVGIMESSDDSIAWYWEEEDVQVKE